MWALDPILKVLGKIYRQLVSNREIAEETNKKLDQIIKLLTPPPDNELSGTVDKPVNQ